MRRPISNRLAGRSMVSRRPTGSRLLNASCGNERSRNQESPDVECSRLVIQGPWRLLRWPRNLGQSGRIYAGVRRQAITVIALVADPHTRRTLALVRFPAVVGPALVRFPAVVGPALVDPRARETPRSSNHRRSSDPWRSSGPRGADWVGACSTRPRLGLNTASAPRSRPWALGLAESLQRPEIRPRRCA